MLNTICDVFNLFSVLAFKVRQYSIIRVIRTVKNLNLHKYY